MHIEPTHTHGDDPSSSSLETRREHKITGCLYCFHHFTAFPTPPLPLSFLLLSLSPHSFPASFTFPIVLCLSKLALLAVSALPWIEAAPSLTALPITRTLKIQEAHVSKWRNSSVKTLPPTLMPPVRAFVVYSNASPSNHIHLNSLSTPPILVFLCVISSHQLFLLHKFIVSSFLPSLFPLPTLKFSHRKCPFRHNRGYERPLGTER